MALSFPLVDNDEIHVQYSSWRVITSLDLVAATVLIYDYSLTFEREVRLVWPAKWTLGKLLYFLTRYIVVIDTFIAIAISFIHIETFHTCSVLYSLVCWFEVIGIGIAEAILLLRTWALYNRDRRVLITLGIVFIAIEIATAISVQIFLNSIEWLLINDLPGCNVITANHILFTAYALLMVFETIVLIMTAKQAIHKSKQYTSSIVQVVYRDGVVYYAYLFVLSVINVVVLIAAPTAYGNVLACLQRVLHTTFSSRILLHMRQAASGDMINGSIRMTSTTTHNPASSMEFQVHNSIQVGSMSVPPDSMRTWFGGKNQENYPLTEFGHSEDTIGNAHSVAS